MLCEEAVAGCPNEGVEKLSCEVEKASSHPRADVVREVALPDPLVVLWLADMDVKLFTTEAEEFFSACAAEKMEMSPAFPVRKGL